MKARFWTRKRLSLALAVALVAVPVAYAARAAGAETEMLFACVKKSSGQLRYAAAAGDCRASSERLIRFRDGEPVAACAHRGGFVYAVAARSACKSKKHRPSLALMLPNDERHTFCADKRRGWLRSTQHAPYPRQRPPRAVDTACKSGERRVFVKRAKRPNAVDDSATVDEDHAASIAVLANDLARKNKPLTVASVDTSGTQGSVAIAADQLSVTYDPNGQFEELGVGASATDSFTYVATDGKRSDSATVTVTVTGVNDAPSAVADAASTNEDTATTIAVLANDTDPDQGDVLSVTAVNTTGTAGAVTINPGGTVLYDPSGEFDDLAPGEQRVDQFGYTASDGHGGTASATVSVTVTGVNDAATITTTAGALAYTEGDPATVVDAGLTVADADDTSLEGARVRISAGFQLADELLFTNQLGITGSYNAGTGVLTLTGTSSVANYQAALRTVEYRHSGDDPAAVKTIEFRADDGDGLGPAATRDVAVTPVNDAPALDTTDTALDYTEGDGAVAADAGIAVTDPDSALLSGATVQITSNFLSAEDDLGFTDQLGITGSYDDTTGTLTLSGTATVSNYQTALRAVTYENVSSNPSTATRTVSFQVTDAGALASNVATRDITLTGANDAPFVTTTGGSTAYTENAVAVVVDGGLTVSDGDDTNLEGATVSIVTGFDAGDVLEFTNQNGISGVYNTGTGVLTLTGTSSVANYQTALRSVGFSSTNDNPALSKTVEFTANDGTADSAPAVKSIAVTRVNDAPALDTTNAALAYPEGAGPVAADAGITATDPDSTQLQGATVQITSNFVSAEDELAFADQLGITGSYDDTTGTLTLSGTASVADYQAALRTVTYENSSNNPSTATRTLTFLATDAEGATSAPATRDITIGAANDAATITTTAAALLYTEGDPATAVDPGLTVSDPDDANLEGATVRISAGFESADELLFTNQNGITGSYNSGTGVLTLTGTSSLANYQTALRSVQFRSTSDNPALVKTVEFRADDGDGLGPASTRNIDITRVDDPPVAVDDTATVAEGSGASAIDVLANDTDADGGAITIASASDPANGTVVLTGGLPGAHTGLTYQPDPNYCNDPPGTTPDTFTYTLNGGDTATVSVKVTCADDPPTAVGDSATVGEDSGANAIDVLANDTDTDGGPKTIESASDPANGTVVITGGGAGLTYEPDPNYCNDPPGTTPDTFTYTLNGGSSATVSVAVTCVDDSPIAVNDSATVAEDSGANAIDVLANDTDADGGPKTINSAGDPANGTVVITGGGTGLTYQPDPNYCNDPPGTTPDTFTYTLNGGSTATVSVTVDCAPDDPIVDTSPGSTTYTENDPATAIDAALTVTDPDAGTTITGATVQITGGYAGAQDVLALGGSHPGITPSVAGDTLTLTGDASPGAYQSALRDVTYQNTSDNPSTAARTVTFTVTDDTSRTGSDTKGITVIAVDDPPVAVNDSATVLEDAAATAIPVLTNDTDVDGGPKTINSASDPANGTVVITGGGTGLTYQPDPNYCNDPPGTTPDTFTYTLNGGSTATVSVTVTCVNDAPVADDESFSGANSAIGNTTLVVNDPDDGAPSTPDPTDTSPVTDRPHKTISGDILAGDADIDGPGPLTITPGTFSTNDGGTVTVQADGDFTFEPAPSTSCTDTSDFFDYTVEDSGSPEQTDTGRVTIAISGCVWYVNNDDAQGNSGTSEKPFDTLAQAETASGTGHSIFVYDGNDTTSGYNAGISLKANQKLIGEAATLTVGADTLHSADAANKPTITDNNADVIDLDDGNEVKGFVIDPQGTGGGIAGALGDTGGGTIDDVNITDISAFGTQPGLELDSTTGTFNVSNFTVSTNGATGVRLNNAGTVTFAPTGTISITSANAAGLDASGTTMGTSTFDSITVTGSGNGGVSVVNNASGTTTFGDLALTTTSGAAPAFRLVSAGTVSVPAASTDNVSATGGPAVDVQSTSGAQLAFDDVDSTNSAGDGINLDGLGTGTFSAASGDIGGYAGIGFDLNGGSGAITYPGNLNNGSGLTAVEITGRTGGAVGLSGSLNDTNDAGGGISLSGNTGGSTTFSGTTKTLNTTTSDAVSFSSSDGHTLSFTNGNLDIDTTTGQGLFANNSGTLGVSGTGNTIDSISATALSVTNTDIGVGGATFQRISAGNSTAAADPLNGIALNTTGTNAALTVIGTGGTCTNADTSGCSGGVIQNTTGADNSGALPPGTGIVLNDTRGVSLTRMHIHDHQNYGIRGTSVNGFMLADSVLNGTNGTSDVTGIRDSSARFENLNGTVSVTNADISGGYTDNFLVSNTSGALSATLTANDFGSVSTAGGDDSLNIIGTGTSEVDATVQNGTFNSARGDIFQYAGNGTGGGDLAFTGNTVTNTHPAIATGGGGITISGSAAGPETINVSNNSMRDALTNALTIVKSQGSGTFTGTINNNSIGDFVAPLDPNAGSLEGAGIEVTTFGGGGNTTLNITNNQIRQYNTFGMSLVAGGGIASSGQFNFNISGNTISNEGTNPNVTLFQGIGVNSGVAAGDTFQTCVKFGANSIAGSGSDTITDSDFRIRARQNTTVRLPGYAGGATDGVAAATFVESQIGGGAQGTAAAFDSGTFIGTGTTCP